MEYSLSSLISAAERAGISLAEAAVRNEEKFNGLTADVIQSRMREALYVMRQSAEKGFDPKLRSMSRMTGGQAPKLISAVAQGQTVGGNYLGRAAARALAIAECNAAMGKIVAAPTAGACGILPAALLTALTVTSSAGTASDKTDVSYSGYTPAAGERSVYKIGSTVVPTALGQILSIGSNSEQWTAATFPLDELTAASGAKITVAVVDSTDAVIASGNATIVSND